MIKSMSRYLPSAFGPRLLASALAVLLTACQSALPRAQAAPVRAQQSAAGACVPRFPFKDGWLGGDGAYSVPLGGQTLWLFGDTFVGPNPTRAGAGMVGNSIGLSRCGPQGFEIDYFFGAPQTGKPGPFFPDSPHKFWPIHGFVHQDKLYVALEEIASAPGDPDNSFNFAVVGVTLAEIGRYSEPPARWQIRYLPLARSREAIPGVAIVKQDAYAYLLTVREDAAKKHPVLLTRLALNRLADPARALEYLGRGGWKPGLSGPDAVSLVDSAATEISLHYEAGRKQWVMVHTEPAFWSKGIVIRRAPAIEGPWDRAVTTEPLYQEMNPADPLFDKETFCYAAKAHPQFSTAAALTVTYACNSLNFAKLIQQPGLYYPVVRQVPWPER